MKGKTCVTIAVMSFLFVASFGSVLSSGFSGNIQQSNGAREDWFDNRWHHRMYLQVNASGYSRSAYPIDVLVDFGDYIDNLDDNSIRVFDNGTLIPSQYNPVNATAGYVIFVINETMLSDDVKNFTVYFDDEASGLKPVPDYGDPVYVTDYQKLAEEGKFLGSSPLNGSTDSWFFPSWLNYSLYSYQDRRVGDVKAVWDAWGDGWNGTDWIRHYAKAVAYRDSFNVYVSVWNNASDSEMAYASGLLNISTGRPWYGPENVDRKDWGLNVLTDQWDVHNVSAIDFGCCPVLASGSVDTYNQLLNKSCVVTFAPADTSDALLLPQSDSIVSIETVVNLTDGNNSIVDPSQYALWDNHTSDMDGIDFYFTAVPGESFEVNYSVKKYDWSDELRVNAKNGTLEYLITYDSDNETNDPYDNPQISAIIFPEQIAASNMVVEFWENRTLRAPGDPFFDYYLNISTNYREWWYNTTLTPEQNHDDQENEFEFILSYLNGSSDAEADVTGFIDSYENPADVSIVKHESAIPISLVVHSPLNGQSFNAWIAMPSLPLSANMTINVTAGGETLDRTYYKLGANGTEVDFSGTVSIPLSSIDGDALDGRILLHVVAEDTNGTKITEIITVFIVKTWYQSLFSAFGTMMIVIGSVFASILAMCGLAAIRKNRSGRKASI